MDDTKTQDSKKTVVAFVAGLLIGGLLVWMFSGTPKAPAPYKTSGDYTATTSTKEQVVATQATTTTTEKMGTTTAVHLSTQSDFTFMVVNQPKGMTVSLGDNVKYPTTEGWIAVQDEINGKLGNVLGASRYNTDVGLTPNSVELLRSTEAGKTYHVVYYTESGDRVFNRADDLPMKASGGGLIEATFVAQ